MPQRLYPPEAPQSIGEILDSVFRIFRASLVKCLPFGIAAVVVSEIPAMYALAAGLPRGQAPASSVWWALYAVSTVISIVIWAALLRRVRAVATGESTSGRRELSAAIGRLPALLGGLVLAGLAGGASLVPFAAVTALAGQAAGLPLLVVALYVGIPLLFASPPIVLEGSGPLDGVRRGFHLVHRNWWRTFGVLLVALVLVIVFYAVGGLLAAMAMPFAGTADVALVTAVSTVVVIVIGSLGAPFGCALVLAIYGDLTVRREGGDLRERLARLPAE